ncbi:MAG: TonB family protein [Rhodocyclales bacterium]|nr:TonB family protein [Rhodocyclales bacterium]
MRLPAHEAPRAAPPAPARLAQAAPRFAQRLPQAPAPPEPALPDTAPAVAPAPPPLLAAPDEPHAPSAGALAAAARAPLEHSNLEGMSAAGNRSFLDGYAAAIAAQIARQRSYPLLAQLRGWEGTATLRLRLADGQLREASLASSSGREVLDRQALAMAQALAAWPAPPPQLRGSDVVVLVPVVFRLE